MAEPITWRNINAPNFGAANQLAQSAGNRLSSGIEGLRAALTPDLEQETANWNRVKDNNTNTLLARIQGAASLGQQQALGADVNPTSLLQDFGQQVDSLKVMQAMNQRARDIRSDETSQDTFEQLQADKGERDIRGWIEQLTAQGSYNDAEALTKEAGVMRHSTRADLLEGIEKAKEGDQDRAWTLEQRNTQRKKNKQSDQEYAEKKQADQLLQQVLARTDLDERGQQALVLSAAKENDISASVITNVMSRLGDGYSERYNLTPEENERLQVAQSQIDRVFAGDEIEQNSIKAANQEALNMIPDFANPTRKPITAGQLNDVILKDHNITLGEFMDLDPGDMDSFHETMNDILKDTMDIINKGNDSDALKAVRTEKELKEEVYNLQALQAVKGNLNLEFIAEAISRSGLTDYDEDGAELYKYQVMDQVATLLKEMNAHYTNYETYRSNIESADGRLNGIQAEKGRLLKGAQDSMKAESRLKLQARQNR